MVVDGHRVAVEAKPLEMLRQLLLRAGNVVSKEELLDTVWPDVNVVEASLTTAVRKLRTALRDDKRRKPIIETVPRIGYRLAVPVEVEELGVPPAPSITVVPAVKGAVPQAQAPPAAAAQARLQPAMMLTIAAALSIAVAVAAGVSSSRDPVPVAATVAPPKYTHREAGDAIRELDLEAIERMIAAGWDPAAPWDKEGNDALGVLLNRCEWDPAHDRRRMLLMARTLIEGGAPIDRRNVWGDTAYSIAKAPRYCGPDHPVTQMLEAMCYGGTMGPKDLCLATYELSAAQRKAQGLPPKAKT